MPLRINIRKFKIRDYGGRVGKMLEDREVSRMS